MIQPPTDNLYKFLAIAGLIVFGFSWYIALQPLAENNREVTKWNAAWGPLIEREMQQYESAREALDCAIADAELREAGKNRLDSDKCARVKAASERLKSESRDIAVAAAELSSGKQMLDYLHSQTVLYLSVALALGLIGLAACITGFCLWYLRLQRYLDADAAKDT